MTTLNTYPASEGDDLYRIAAKIYGDALGWTILARANGLTDPLLAQDVSLVVPPYTKQRANDGALSA